MFSLICTSEVPSWCLLWSTWTSLIKMTDQHLLPSTPPPTTFISSTVYMSLDPKVDPMGSSECCVVSSCSSHCGWGWSKLALLFFDNRQDITNENMVTSTKKQKSVPLRIHTMKGRPSIYMFAHHGVKGESCDVEDKRSSCKSLHWWIKLWWTLDGKGAFQELFFPTSTTWHSIVDQLRGSADVQCGAASGVWYQRHTKFSQRPGETDNTAAVDSNLDKPLRNLHVWLHWDTEMQISNSIESILAHFPPQTCERQSRWAEKKLSVFSTHSRSLVFCGS